MTIGSFSVVVISPLPFVIIAMTCTYLHVTTLLVTCQFPKALAYFSTPLQLETSRSSPAQSYAKRKDRCCTPYKYPASRYVRVTDRPSTTDGDSSHEYPGECSHDQAIVLLKKRQTHARSCD